MNKQQIKAELRRVACEEDYLIVSLEAAWELTEFMSYETGEMIHMMEDHHRRIFYLLVAEAL